MPEPSLDRLVLAIPCYFLLNFGVERFEKRRTFRIGHLAIFFWILNISTTIDVIAMPIVSLLFSFEFWSLLTEIDCYDNYCLIGLLFSFEFCLDRLVLAMLASLAETCYFLLNFAANDAVSYYHLLASSALLFSFEFCSSTLCLFVFSSGVLDLAIFFWILENVKGW